MTEGMEEKLALKRRVFEACLERQQTMVRNAKDAVREAQENANTSEESAEDGFVSYREQLQHTRDMYTMQLQNALNELEILQQVPVHDVTKTIETGAVVHTDKQNFFISVSVPKIEVDKKTYFPISTSAPIFQAMVGLKQGEAFSFRDRNYRILEVF